MARRRIPYLQRRGDAYVFRMAVPADLRPVIQRTEIIRGLGNQKPIAHKTCLELAACFTNLFERLRMDNETLLPLVQAKRKELRATIRAENLELQLDEQIKAHKAALQQQASDHAAKLQLSLLEQKADLLAKQVEAMAKQPTPGIAIAPSPHSENAPMLADVIDDFLAQYRTKPNAGQKPSDDSEMKRRHTTNLTRLFLPIVGNRPISQIKQRDITSFLNTVCRKLPTNWRHIKGKTIQEILAGTYEHHELASPGTFKNSYLATTRTFVEWCGSQYVDQGWPANITIKGIEYAGHRASGENKQRSLSPQEIKRIFEGREMAEFARDPTRAHMFWLLHLGLYIGGRIREICQLNPQCDFIVRDNVPALRLTGDGDAGDGVSKSIKTVARTIPIPPQLIELGILEWLDHIRAQGHTRLFPEWSVPADGDAGREPGEWFSDFLRQTSLRDETEGRCLTGFHALRHTVETYAYNQNIPRIGVITGHADDSKTKIVRGYIDPEMMTMRQKLEQITPLKYDVKHIKPSHHWHKR